jgi:hypothetical protein
LQTSGSPIFSAALGSAPSRARNLSPRLHVHAGATPRSVKKASFARISLRPPGVGIGKSREIFMEKALHLVVIDEQHDGIGALIIH